MLYCVSFLGYFLHCTRKDRSCRKSLYLYLFILFGDATLYVSYSIFYNLMGQTALEATINCGLQYINIDHLIEETPGESSNRMQACKYSIKLELNMPKENEPVVIYNLGIMFTRCPINGFYFSSLIYDSVTRLMFRFCT